MQTKTWCTVNTHHPRVTPLHEYFGSTGTRYLSIQEHSDYLSLAHIFGGIVAFWRYTYDGRIQTIGFKVPKEHWYYNALKIHKTNMPIKWSEGFAYYESLPEQTSLIEKDITYLHPMDQFNNLIAKGKDDIEKVLASLTLEDEDTKRRPNQLPLRAIKESCRLLGALESVVSLEPVLNVMNKKEMNIRYLQRD